MEGYPIAAPKAICPGCGRHFPEVELVEIESGEEYLTYLSGELLCLGCYLVAA